MEKTIRLRGLPKKHVSRRARLLHHIYAWTRIISESTNVCFDEIPREEFAEISVNPKDNREAANVGGSSGGRLAKHSSLRSEVTLDNFLRLETRPSDDDDLNIHSHKDANSSVRDIHLADSRQDSENMYMEIYGVPETWLSLVSQTTRLANVLDHLSIGDSSDAQRFMSLQSRVSRLEDTICAFVSRSESSLAEQIEQCTSPRGPMPHKYMVHVLSSALLIYFYRRIRGVNPCILQTKVNDVLFSLHSFDEALARHGLLGPGTAWPIFVAGAEAMSGSQREWILSWLEKAVTKCGFESYKVTKEILVEVWRRRDRGIVSSRTGMIGSRATIESTAFCTWVDTCRSMRKWPLLC